MDWPRLPFRRNADRFVRYDMCGTGGQGEGRLGDRSEDLRLVQNLMRVGLGCVGIDGTGQNNHWHPVLSRILDNVDPVQRARSDRANQDARCARAVIRPFGHEAGCVFMASQNKSYARLLQRINQREDFTARHAECPAASREIKPLGQDVCGAKSSRGHLNDPLCG